jgi:hypothetical protein
VSDDADLPSAADSDPSEESFVPKVVRSDVPAGLPYKSYGPYLRKDFWFSCAYCTTMESEATAARMLIDHYEPQKAHPELANVYTNLMYACEPCNSRKSDRCPPPEARKDGHRFFRADEDRRLEHFAYNGVRVEPKSAVGDYTITFLSLNRKGLIRLRELRIRLMESGSFVHEGIRALRSIPPDRLPPEMRARAMRMVDSVLSRNQKLVENIDDLLTSYARSPLKDAEESGEDEAERLERERRMRKFQAMYPGNWSGRGKARGK